MNEYEWKQAINANTEKIEYLIDETARLWNKLEELKNETNSTTKQ